MQRISGEILFWHQEILGHATGNDARGAPCRALDELTTLTGPAGKTRRMMVDKNSVPGLEVRHPSTHRDHLTSGLMTKDQGRLLFHIPAHDIARTDATGPRSH